MVHLLSSIVTMRSLSHSTGLFLAMLAASPVDMAAAEKVLGAYIFARHGDRTAKVLGNTRLTDLGYDEVFQAGSYYHGRYVSSSSPLQIAGISEQIVNQSQLSASAPSDTVIQNSGTGFLQGVYPPVGSVAAETLANGTRVEAPLNGYQLIPLSMVPTGGSSENSAWLQSDTLCQNAEVSSNNFYLSPLYQTLLSATSNLYESLASIVGPVFTKSELSFKNAYLIWDYLNVASIHNASEPLPSTGVLDELLDLANVQQLNLAWNASDPIRAIAGSLLAGDVLNALNQTITSQGERSKLTLQFGSYGTFQSYFGLAQLLDVNNDFMGMPIYASSMAWELVTNSTMSNGFPSAAEISVRFLFHNGTITAGSEPASYPLFGLTSDLISWSDFVAQTEKFAVTSHTQWCQVCGNTAGSCASVASSNPGYTVPPDFTSSPDSHGMSRAVAGVVGAMVTLAVILGLEALFLLVGGFRISKKRSTADAIALGTTTIVDGNKA